LRENGASPTKRRGIKGVRYIYRLLVLDNEFVYRISYLVFGPS
jgi:hypothetical protein